MKFHFEAQLDDANMRTYLDIADALVLTAPSISTLDYYPQLDDTGAVQDRFGRVVGKWMIVQDVAKAAQPPHEAEVTLGQYTHEHNPPPPPIGQTNAALKAALSRAEQNAKRAMGYSDEGVQEQVQGQVQGQEVKACSTLESVPSAS